MDRIKSAEYMINYLEKRINCKNIIKFADEHMQSKLGEGKEAIVNELKIGKTSVAFKIMKYNDTEGYIRIKKTDPKDKIWVNNMFDTFDFMTEANYTGFGYFPYLYGVLNCHEEENSKIYVFYEVFDGNLIDLINNIQHPSEWYDIVFQMIMINYYIETINGYRYNDGTVQNHLFRKLDKSYYKEYQLDNYKFSINHKYLIVLWDINYMEKITEENKSQVISNIDFLIKYLDTNKDHIKILPSGRIISLLHDVKNNPNNVPNLLDQYYNIKS